MSDLPPDESSPRQPAGGPDVPAVAPPRAFPAVPPAPVPDRAAVLPASSGEQAAAQLPPPWAGSTVGTASAAPGALPGPGPWSEAPGALSGPGPSGPAASPPSAWYGPAAGAPPGWHAPAAPAPAPRASMIDRARLLPTVVVAVIVAAVVLGGIGLDTVIAAPSAGTVAVGDSVTMTAAPGWVLVSPAGRHRRRRAAAEGQRHPHRRRSSRRATPATRPRCCPSQEQSLNDQSAQISYGDAHRALGQRSRHHVRRLRGGRLVGRPVGHRRRRAHLHGRRGNAVVIVVAAPQGDLDPVIDDVSAMLKSVGVGR